VTRPIERRYRSLLRMYPAAYRARRGDELVDTYLATVGPDRRWPGAMDTVDLFTGALRERIRAANARGLEAGVPVAATLALATGAFLATVWLLWVETRWDPRHPGSAAAPVGPLYSVAAFAWLGWIAAAVAHAVRPGRAARLFVAAALVETVAIWPVCAYLGTTPPPTLVVASQLVLAFVALALPARPPAATRLAPVLTVVVVAVATVVLNPSRAINGYRWYLDDLLPGTGVAVVLAGLVVAAAYGLRRDDRGGWAALIMLTPACALLLGPVARMITRSGAGWSALVVCAVALTGLAAAVVPTAVVVRSTYSRRTPPPCPTRDRPGERRD
jgi:hypothetical protein